MGEKAELCGCYIWSFLANYCWANSSSTLRNQCELELANRKLKFIIRRTDVCSELGYENLSPANDEHEFTEDQTKFTLNEIMITWKTEPALTSSGSVGRQENIQWILVVFTG
jgi:hypothetical protein